MNVKYVVALILALQVSVSVCDVPEPSQELVDKYNQMRSTFMSRIMVLYNKVQEAAAPMVESAGQNDQTSLIKTFIEDMQEKPEAQALIKFLSGLTQEASPLVDKARLSLLGLYEKYLRPNHGDSLDSFINNHLKPFLDTVAPVPAQ
ncbi:apolipoprotein A-II [Labrus mixtus]|uniref:apolipoprotein A-II n=1 Tax=Labrus mixtus TaxID=508554 RepID=UPI0029C0CF67|nr:apolipoprotein A-II [Labrus mixtus]